VARSIPIPAARGALVNAYHVGFSATLNHLMDIGAVVAFVGALCAFALVRQRDFVIPTGAGAPPGAAAHGDAATTTGAPADAGMPAAHA